MNRNLAAAVVVGVAGLTAAVVFLLSPGTGPDIGPAPEPLPASPVVPNVAAKAAPSPRPTPRPPVRRRGRPGAEGLELRMPGVGPAGPVGKGPRGALGPRRGPPPVRDRYTERGHERILAGLRAVAVDQEWDGGKLAEVETILEQGRKQGLEVLQTHAAADSDKADLARDLLEVREEEQQALEAALGPDADIVLRKSGYMGRRARTRK